MPPLALPSLKRRRLILALRAVDGWQEGKAIDKSRKAFLDTIALRWRCALGARALAYARKADFDSAWNGRFAQFPRIFHRARGSNSCWLDLVANPANTIACYFPIFVLPASVICTIQLTSLAQPSAVTCETIFFSFAFDHFCD
ncbi:hypothetical protein [Bradyrhizobium ottawaense]|uniref:hypothetical protein n=1 Tax=Bradyrhizobium ottawaense TaxID=931866 RepID=UPI0015CF2DA5|nr:hypothetical protein [Bradyrhizobium ottawaense]